MKGHPGHLLVFFFCFVFSCPLGFQIKLLYARNTKCLSCYFYSSWLHLLYITKDNFRYAKLTMINSFTCKNFLCAMWILTLKPQDTYCCGRNGVGYPGSHYFDQYSQQPANLCLLSVRIKRKFHFAKCKLFSILILYIRKTGTHLTLFSLYTDKQDFKCIFSWF